MTKWICAIQKVQGQSSIIVANKLQVNGDASTNLHVYF